VLIVVVVRLWPGAEVITPAVMLAGLSFQIYIPLLLPIVALAVGTSAIGEQLSDGTIVYYWSRPVRRGAIYLGRLTAAQLVAAVLLIASLAGCFVATLFGRLDMLTFALIKHYLGACVIAVIGAWIYTALFAWLGTVVRRPLLPGILFAFGWEPLVSAIPQRIQEYTIRFHLRNLIERPEMPQSGLADVLAEVLERVLAKEAVPKWQSLSVLLAVLLVATGLGIWSLGRKEIAQRPS
jgi:ABC-type transport system involved in multi-copper enzyme maturation permease subunit